ITLQVGPLPAYEVGCAPGVLAVVLDNLVGNAIKFMGTSARRLVEGRARPVGDPGRLGGEDSGPGRPVGVGELALQPFGRGPGAREPGLGLGLGTVRRLVEAHGGHVGAASLPDAGALVWVELPRAPSA